VRDWPMPPPIKGGSLLCAVPWWRKSQIFDQSASQVVCPWVSGLTGELIPPAPRTWFQN